MALIADDAWAQAFRAPRAGEPIRPVPRHHPLPGPRPRGPSRRHLAPHVFVLLLVRIAAAAMDTDHAAHNHTASDVFLFIIVLLIIAALVVVVAVSFVAGFLMACALRLMSCLTMTRRPAAAVNDTKRRNIDCPVDNSLCDGARCVLSHPL